VERLLFFSLSFPLGGWVTHTVAQDRDAGGKPAKGAQRGACRGAVARKGQYSGPRAPCASRLATA
jgi:hypothetical protein